MTAKHTLKLSTEDSVLPIHAKPEAGVNNGYYWLDAVTYQCVMKNVTDPYQTRSDWLVGGAYSLSRTKDHIPAYKHLPNASAQQ